jgi:hypothetical protein
MHIIMYAPELLCNQSIAEGFFLCENSQSDEHLLVGFTASASVHYHSIL